MPAYNEISFCFLDAEKEIYQDVFELAAPNLVPGGILLADNAISHQAEMQEMLELALQDKRFDSQIIPVGKGLLMCRKLRLPLTAV